MTLGGRASKMTMMPSFFFVFGALSPLLRPWCRGVREKQLGVKRRREKHERECFLLFPKKRRKEREIVVF